MKLNKVLIVYRHKVSVGEKAVRSKASRQTIHDAALETIKRELAARRIDFFPIDRNDLKGALSGDLIISAGGDGTVLAAAHLADESPILGVNTMPGHSVGYFCAAVPEDFGLLIDQIIRGKIRPRKLPLLEGTVDSKPLPILALNEILFAGSTPAETASYVLKVGKKSARQKSSGIWIAAGPGSTAAIYSAGGKKLPIVSKRLQFLVREPCRISGHHAGGLIHGIGKSGDRISITSLMSDGFVYIDGAKIACPVPAGSTLEVKISRRTLSLFI